jgi:hypothetical protein
MDTEYERSRLEFAKRGLYKPGDVNPEDRGLPQLTPSKVDVGQDWEDTDISPTRHRVAYQMGAAFARKLLLAAVLAVFGSGSYLLWQFFDPMEKPSDKNIIITLDTPVAITPGVSADIIVRVANQNRVALEASSLAVVFPSGTRVALDTGTDLKEETKALGAIMPGEAVEYRTKAVFLGEENEEKSILARLDFRFENMNSSFSKEESRPVRMLASPVNLTMNMLKEVNAGQIIDIGVTAVSNTSIPLRDVLLKIDYPQGFSFDSAEPKPSFGNNIWRVGNLNPSSKFALKIKGVLEGTDTDKRLFRGSVGVGGDKTGRDIVTTYGKVAAETSVERPFIGIALTINGKPAGDALANYGRKVEGVIDWKNNISGRITNAQIDVRLTGVALNRGSVSPDNGGFFRSIDNTIIWDYRGNPALTTLESGERGSVKFSFEPLPPASGNELITNPVITAEVTVRGERISDANVPEEVRTVMAQNVRVVSDVQFVSRALYYAGPFANIGPLPPRPEQETSYTIVWTIVNTSSALHTARVRAILPPYIGWYGSVSPGKEKVSFNKLTNEIVWEAGDIPAGTGISTPPKEVAFQVVLTPSVTQVKTEPALLLNQLFTAIDSFTKTELSIKGKPVTTYLSTDPSAALDSREVAP